jgi:hypothetical protein
MHAESPKCPDHDLFDIPEVPVQIKVVSVQVKDRVPDELALTMVRDVAAAIVHIERDAAFTEFPLAGKKVVGVAIAANGVDVPVLCQDQNIRDLAGQPEIKETLLKIPAGLVAGDPQIGNQECCTQGFILRY